VSDFDAAASAAAFVLKFPMTFALPPLMVWPASASPMNFGYSAPA
jgi:hypothetical protein